MSEAESLFDQLRQSADPEAESAIEQLIYKGSDRDLCRINVLDFAKTAGSVVENPRASQVLQTSGLKPSAQHIALRSVNENLKIYEIS